MRPPRRPLAALLLALSLPGAHAAPPATEVAVYLVTPAPSGGASFGCGDRLVRVTRRLPTTRAPLRAALNDLLNLRAPPAGLRSAFSASRLTVTRVERRGPGVLVSLAGSLRLNGVCDAPRVTEQLRATATQFAGVRAACFFVNGEPIERLLDESGRDIPPDVCLARLP